MSITIHGAPTSPFVRKARIVLAEKGVPHELVPLNPFDKTPELLRLNPLGRIPILEEADGFTLAESSVICDYLERRHPDPPLYPSDARERARALWIESYVSARLVETVGPVFGMAVIEPALSGSPPDRAAIDGHVADTFPGALDYLEEQAPDGDVIVGSDFGIADVAVVSAVRMLEMAGASIDASRWPRFARYTSVLLQRKSVRDCAAAEDAFVEGLRALGAP